MQILVNKETKRIEGYCTVGSIEPSATQEVYEISDLIDEEKLLMSTYENGEIIYHEEWLLSEQQKEEIQNMRLEQEMLFSRMQRQNALRSLSDVQAFSVELLYDEWTSGTEYEKGDRVMFQGLFYKCIKEEKHISNDTIDPLKANYIWVEIADPTIEYPPFKKPLGYADAYNDGDKITFEGKRYICNMDGCIYSPAEYPQAWKEN